MKSLWNGLSWFFNSKVGVLMAASIFWTVSGAIAVQFKDSIPWLASVCNMNEACKVKMGDFEVAFTPRPVNAINPENVRTTTETSAPVAVVVNIPVNTSATTDSTAPAAQ